MALQHIRKSPLRAKKFVGALVAIAAFLAQPFAVLPINTAFAATIGVTPTSHTVAGGVTATSSADTSTYENLSLSFDHVAENLEAGDSFVYGWRDGVGGADNQLGVIAGQPNTGGNPGVGENDSKVVALPPAAQVSDLVLYFTNTGTTNDDVDISNIALTGDSVEQNAVCASGCEYSTLADAVAGEAAGSTITVKENQTVTSTVLVNKQLTITGTPGVTISTSGSNLVFTTTADGVVISGLNFTKTDKVNQNLINVQGDNTTISDNTFTGQYTLAANDHTSRALDVSGSAQGLTISGNTFTMLRQPAYLNNGAAGTISDNTTSQTRGWVVEAGTNFAFSGNMWGSDSDRNVIDIAVIAGSPNNYSDVVALSEANNNALVQNQVSGTFSTVYVDANAAAGGNGYWQTPYKTITAGLNAVAAGGHVVIQPGTYTENVTVSKSIDLTGTGVTLVGQISVYSSDVSISDFTITNPSYNGPTIRGVHVYGDNSGIGNVSVTDNVFTNIRNNNTKGAFAVMVQGNVTGVTVTGNTINGVSSAGWAHGIEVTPGGGVTGVPTGVVITGNTVSGVTNDSHTDQYDFSVDSSGSATADASEITFTNNGLSGNVRNLDTTHTLDATANWWGVSTGPTSSQYTSSVTVAPWCEQAACTSLFSSKPVQLEATSGVAMIDPVTPLTLSDGTVEAVIPAGTTVTSSDSSWDGTIKAPATSSYSVPGSSTTTLAITVGSDDSSLTFDQPVKLTFPGQHGKHVGFLSVLAGSTFTEITATCDSLTSPTVSAGGACKIDDGNDLVVWTKHFTTFATYTVATNNGGGSGGGSGSSSGSSTTSGSTFTPTTVFAESFGTASNNGTKSSNGIKDNGQVLGTSTNNAKKNTASASTKNDKGLIFGLAWYWWVVILAAIGAVWWLVSAWRNRRDTL